MSIASIIAWTLATGVAILLLLVIYNHVPVDDGNEYERVVFVPGIKTNPEYLNGWRLFLKHHFSNADLVFVEGRYHFDNLEQIQDIQSKTVKALRGNAKTLVITHSYGGLQTMAALQNNKIDSVVRIIHMAPAFDQTFEDLRESKDLISYSPVATDIDMKIICGIFDTTVPCKSTSYPEVIEKTRVVSWHPTFLLPQVFWGRTILK